MVKNGKQATINAFLHNMACMYFCNNKHKNGHSHATVDIAKLHPILVQTWSANPTSHADTFSDVKIIETQQQHKSIQPAKHANSALALTTSKIKCNKNKHFLCIFQHEWCTCYLENVKHEGNVHIKSASYNEFFPL